MRNVWRCDQGRNWLMRPPAWCDLFSEPDHVKQWCASRPLPRSSIYIYIYMTICIEGVLILSMILIPIIYGATHPMVGLRYPWKGGLISFSSFWPYVLYWSGHHRRCNQNQFCFLFWGMVRLTERNVFLHIRSGISII